MASGLMTLAYMGEMAVVFNLAYLELNKERYVKIPKESAQALHKSISDPPGGLGAIVILKYGIGNGQDSS